jgi:FSR family fosmidomycin resistance protein-like MFS transporter
LAKKGIALTVLSAAHATNHIYQLVLPVAMPKIVGEYGLSGFSMGMLTACFIIPFSLLQIVFGSLLRRVSRRLLMSFGLALNSVAFLAIIFSEDIRLLALLLLLAGVGGSTYHPIGIPFVSELFLERRGQALGFHQTGGAIGSFLAPMAIGAIAELLGWRSAFSIMSSLGFLLLPFLWLSLEEPKRSEKFHRRGNMGVLRQALLLILAVTIGLLGLRGLTPFATQYFGENKGVTYAEATIFFSLLQVAGIFSGPICGRVSDILGRKRIISILILIQSISLFSITLTSNVLLALACVVFGFTTFGLLATTDALFADITPPDFLGTVIGFNLAASYGVSAIIPPLLGSMIDVYGFEYAFTVLSVLIPISIILLAIAKSV